MLTEVSEYLQAIERQRSKVWQALESAPPAVWNWTPTDDRTNSLYVIATHVIGSEHGWIYEILADGVKTRDRAAEFLAQGHALTALRAEFERVAEQTRRVLEGLTEADLAGTRYRESHGDVTVRWILLHVIEHCSEHVGQMELTRQVWEKHNA